MKIILFVEKIKNKISRIYNKKLFKAFTNTKHSNFTIYGKLNLINRNIIIGNNVRIDEGVAFWGDGNILIGDNVNIGKDSIIYSSAQGGVFIGNDTSIAAQCYIIDMDHGMSMSKLVREQENTCDKVTIGEDVWIAAGSKILKGSKIGNHAVIGAQSLVKGVIPDCAIAVGIPAKVIKYRKM